MSAPTTTQPPAPDAAPDEEGIRLTGWGMWAAGGAIGTALTLAAAFAVLMGVTGKPNYVTKPTAETIVAEDAAGGAAGNAELTLVATEFAFDPDPASLVRDGTITLDNQGAIFHNLEIEGVAGFIIEADPGAAVVSAIPVDPGTYTIFCSIPGHRDAGMEAQLVVTEA